MDAWKITNYTHSIRYLLPIRVLTGGQMNPKEKIRLHSPLPIAKIYEAMDLEGEPRQRVRKLVDLFERTCQYLVLVGLASYQQQSLSDPKVEDLRPGLVRPSLGHWVELLKAITLSLRPTDPAFLTADPGHVYKDEPIGVLVPQLKDLLGLSGPKKVMIFHFLDTLVEFRNKKIGHGDLSLAEAEQIRQPLEAALMQWLGELPTLFERHLLYVHEVKWQNQRFVYIGTRLNTGISREAFQLEGRPDWTTRRYICICRPAITSCLYHPFLSISPTLMYSMSTVNCLTKMSQSCAVPTMPLVRQPCSPSPLTSR